MKFIQPYYYKGKRGNKPYDLERMLRIYMVQNLYNLSDMATVAEVVDSRSVSEFCGVDSSNQVPDGDTLGRFRNLLIRKELQEKIFDQVVELLSARGLILKKGTIVDSAFIEDKDSGLVHTLKVTSGHVHDVCVAADLLTGEEQQVYGDSGYLGAEKRPEALRKNQSGQRIRYKINRRPSQIKNKSIRSKAQIKRREHEKSSVRAKVEHILLLSNSNCNFVKHDTEVCENRFQN